MISPETAVTLSSAFTSVVGLIGQFKSGRDAASGSDFNDFMTWLVKSNHHEIKSLIEANHATTVGIKAVLGQQSDQLNEALSKIDAAVAAFACTLEGFSDISAGLNPGAKLSPQALEILQQYEDSGASKTLELKLQAHTLLHPLDGTGGSFEISDPRFLQDDLNTLLELRLLTLSHNGKGERLFHFTRSAHELVKPKP